MKIKLHTLALVLPLMAAGSAFGSPIDQSTSSTDIRYTVDSGVATIYGSVESQIEKTLVGHLAAEFDGVETVRNLLVVSD